MKGIPKIVFLVCLLPAMAFARGGSDKIEKLVQPQTGKRVSVLQMRHFDSPDRYAATRRCLDSLKAAGYVIFYESLHLVPFHIDTIGDVTIPQLRAMPIGCSRTDSLLRDTLLRKCRRMLGFMIGEKGYEDAENESLSLKSRNGKRVWQSMELLGLTTEKDLWVDYSMHDIVEVFERKHGPILLTEYDFRIGLTQKYTPPVKVQPRQQDDFSLFLRNDYLVRRVAQSEHPRIAVVYGAAHTPGIVWQLKKRHGFKTDKSK